MSSNEPLLPSAMPLADKQIHRSNKKTTKSKGLLPVVVLAAIVAGSLMLIVALVDHYGSGSMISLTSLWPSSHKNNHKRNVIFMVSDGFGPASETFGRTYYQYLMAGRNSSSSPPPFGTDYPHMLPLDTIMVGQSRTRSANSWITDSAAGATAFSCALKSYNGAIGVNETQSPCGTVMEAAKALGYTTGIVVTSQVTDATPASFSSHVTWRKYENEIAVQQVGSGPIGRVVDLMFGGGLTFFLPNTTAGSSRKDARNLLEEAIDNGFETVITDRQGFDELSGSKSEMPVLGLFNDGHLNYAIDRDPAKEPSLAEMTAKALEFLTAATADSEKGFFLLVEGSRIDMAAHENDAAAHAHEILAYQQTIAVVKGYVDQHPGTVMTSVSDHETGGLTLGRQLTSDYPEYKWKPEVIDRVKNSTALLGAAVTQLKSTEERLKYLQELVLPKWLGVDDYSLEDLAYLADMQRTQGEIVWFMSEMVNRRALLGFSTHGHTGVDVNLYAYAGKIPRSGCHSEVDSLRRNLENIELGEFVEKYLDLAATRNGITQKLLTATAEGTLIMFPANKPPIPSALEEESLLEGTAKGGDWYHQGLLQT